MTLAQNPPLRDVEAIVETAIAHHRSGQAGKAGELYRQALAADPAHPEANHNLGILLLQEGDLAGGLERFRRALQAEPERDLYWVSCARASLMGGRPAEAAVITAAGRRRGFVSDALQALEGQARLAGATALSPLDAAGVLSALELHRDAVGLLREAVAKRPESAQLWRALGAAQAEVGDIEAAAASYEAAVAADPSLHEAHRELGSILSENGRIAEGFAHFMTGAALAGAPSDIKPAPHKAKHDREQLDHLREKGLVDAGLEAAPWRTASGERVPGGALNREAAARVVGVGWERLAPPVLVIDDFLDPVALDRLRDYCAESTVWRRVYDAGYIGATPQDGFACPLLAQMAEEIPALYPQLLGSHRFRYLGAFKYDSELSTGTNTHADYSAVNVNLYIAPDSANLDPETGGMLIWDLEAEDESEMRRFNSDEAALQAHLARSGAARLRVPHRANRAVIFRSSLYHRTDECRFREGYLNKRINVSLLYGDWGP